ASSGLPNLGNTCYANTVFQTLYHIQPFRELARKKFQEFAEKKKKFQEFEKDKEKIEEFEQNNKPLLARLDDLFLSMEKKDGEKEFKLKEIKGVIGDIFKKEMRDAVEFMTKILRKIEKDLNDQKSDDDSEEFRKIFHIDTYGSIVFFITETKDEYTVQNLLKKHMPTENPDTRKTPEVLILQMFIDSRTMNFETSEEITHKDTKYSLSQVGVFTGEDNSGHYYLFAKTENNAWKEFNDMKKSDVGEKEVFEISPSHKGGEGRKAYYLVYTKNTA
ncbi:MAG: uncharacterized protein A8A55_2508, partial [Amphiamblys sp. WSBS2006]